MAKALWRSSDVSEWSEHLETYRERVLALSERRAGLNDLDVWFFDTFTPEVRSRAPPHVTRDELVKVVEWKLKREKFRPRLLGYARALGEEEVVEATTRGFGPLSGKESGPESDAKTGDDESPSACPERDEEDSEDESVGDGGMEESLGCLCELKGVGPATASALLCARDDDFPFMSYEAMDAALGEKRDKYTVERYVELVDKLKEKASELTTEDRKWSAKDVELALYSRRALELTSEKKREGSGEGGSRRKRGRPSK
ncbi:hypothetical protein BSKO_05191 [Bryopsis sp. KO-2023]|nr:hypothetical protein BSKO_05191 [Bryopsis sp. KO-2023]